MKNFFILLQLVRLGSLSCLLLTFSDENRRTLIEFIIFVTLQILQQILKSYKHEKIVQIISCCSSILFLDCLIQQKYNIAEVLGNLSIEIILQFEEQGKNQFVSPNLKYVFLPLLIGFRLMILSMSDKNFLILIQMFIFFIHFLKSVFDYRIQSNNKNIDEQKDVSKANIQLDQIVLEKQVADTREKQENDIRISMSRQKEADQSSRLIEEHGQSNSLSKDFVQFQVPLFKQQLENQNLISDKNLGKVGSDYSSKFIKRATDKYYKEFQILDLLPFGCIIVNKTCQVLYQNSKLHKIFSSENEQEILQHISQIIQGSSLHKKQKTSINHIDSQIDEEQFEKIKNTKGNFNLIDSLISFSGKGQNQIQSQSNFDQSEVNTKFQALLDLSFGSSETLFKRYYKIKVYNNFQRQEIVDTQQLFLILVKDTSKKVQLKKLRKEHIFQNQLLQSFSHELRTPLNCSIQSIQAAIPAQKDIALSYLLKTALGSNFLLLHQINDILDSAAMENRNFQYQWTQFTFKEIITELLDMYSESFQIKGLVFIQDIQKQNYMITFKNDKSRILQILVNLINNSIKYTGQDGKIWISIKPVENQYCRSFRVTIRDNGVGIEEAKLLKIKEALEDQRSLSPILKNQNKFIGLGLLNCCKIAAGLSRSVQKNFEISSTSEGTTTCFYIDDIPISSSYSKSQSFNLSKSPSMTSNNTDADHTIRVPTINFCFDRLNAQKKYLSDQVIRSQYQSQEMINCNCNHILIVDDVPFNHIALKAMLKTFQLSSDSAYDGDQAVIKVVQKMEQHCRTYRLILMDIQMPKMDGFAASREIKFIYTENKIDSPIFMCSAYDTQENIEEALNCYMDGFLFKPIRQDNLKQVLKQVGLIFF